MAYLGNQPLLSTMRTVAEGTAYANQTEIPVPGGYVAGLVDVIVNGSDLGGADYDGTNGASIKLYVPMPVGSYFKVVAWTPNQTVVNAGGQLAGFRNLLINGDLSIWQRGNGNFTAQGMTADRWVLSLSGATATVSRVALPEISTMRTVWSGAGGANSVGLWSNLEFLGQYGGKTVTLSFDAKADSACKMSTHFDVVYGGGGSAYAGPQGIQEHSVGTAWTRISRTFQVEDMTSKTFGTNPFFRPCFFFDNGTLGTTRQASGAVEIRRVQLEFGAVATLFEQRPFQTELMLCHRHYEARVWVLTQPGSNSNYYTLPFYVQKRVPPTISISGGTSLSVGGTTQDCAFITYGGASNINNTFTLISNAEL